MSKRKKGGRPVKFAPPRDEREARVMEAARRAYRLATEKLHEARDPASSKEAYEAVWEASDEVGKTIVGWVEEEEADEDRDLFVDDDGRQWTAVTQDTRTYHTLRGPIRVKRKRHRAVRNGPTRCLFEERRRVMVRGTMPDLGEAVLRAYANVPGDEAAKLLTTLTGHAVSPSPIKEFVVDESTAILEQEEELFDAILASCAVPPAAKTLVVSVDALSLHVRREGWKQATVATPTMLDAEGEPVRRGSGAHTIRIAECRSRARPRSWNRVEREVRAIIAQRPDLALEVVIDGAGDLRTDLLERSSSVSKEERFGVPDGLQDSFVPNIVGDLLPIVFEW